MVLFETAARTKSPSFPWPAAVVFCEALCVLVPLLPAAPCLEGEGEGEGEEDSLLSLPLLSLSLLSLLSLSLLPLLLLLPLWPLLKRDLLRLFSLRPAAGGRVDEE